MNPNIGQLYSLISIFLIVMFLTPMGLKLEHTFSYHSDNIECSHEQTHIHNYNKHNDFLDVYYQPLVEYHFNSEIILNNAQTLFRYIFNNTSIYNRLIFNNLKDRGPPNFFR